MIKVEIKKEMEIDGEVKDLSKALDDYIEKFNSGKLSSKEGWIDPIYRGRYFEHSKNEGVFEIKVVYKEGDKYYFETDSEDVKNRVENEFYVSGKRLYFDKDTGDAVMDGIDIVGTEASYRYNRYKRIYSLSMSWFTDKVILNVFEIHRQFHIHPVRYYEIKFGDRLIYKGPELDHILDRRKRDFLNFLYVPVRILKYKFDTDPKEYIVEDETIYKFPSSIFIDYVTDESLKHKIVYDTKERYKIKNIIGEEIAILVYDEYGTNERRYVKYDVSSGKIHARHETPYTILFRKGVTLPIKEYFEISSELERLKRLSHDIVEPLHYAGILTDSGDKIHDILSNEISPWSSHAVTDTFKNLEISSTFLDFYDRYKVIVDCNTGKEYEGAILGDIDYEDTPNSVPVEFFVDDKDTEYNNKEFIRLFVTTEGKILYKVDDYSKLGINAIAIKDDNGNTKTYVTNGRGKDISKYFLVAKGKYKEELSLYVDLDSELNSFYFDLNIIDKLEEHKLFLETALDDFNKFKYEYERRMKLLEMSVDELIEYFELNDMEADEFRKVYPYITKIKFY